ncbi:MAG: AraC family transcriptional regulator [Acetobacterium sp.]|nr:AraC family transcriptional regulator [Bacillota bacterium]MCG2729996.1 AraC family transcriptional regulator [Acetobacterium sp.]
MKHNEERTVRYDNDLKIEAFCLKGIIQKFPNHFHEYYVIGFIESGHRKLSCKNKEYLVGPGDLLLFNPYDNHFCEQVDDQALDYRCLNIKPEIMRAMVFEITGKQENLVFEQPVVYRSEQVIGLGELHQMLLAEQQGFNKEEAFLFLIEQLIDEYGSWESDHRHQESNAAIELICNYLEKNFQERISLNDLSILTGCSKYYLVRAFTKTKGITPYRYLETVRINAAKALLEEGVEPIDVAMQTGFSDQSHFSNFFKGFIGITPKQYQKIFTDEGSKD